MILQCSLQRDIEIISLKDFKKLKTLEENGLKVNWSRVSKEHGCDRRTAKKYSCGYKKGSINSGVGENCYCQY